MMHRIALCSCSCCPPRTRPGPRRRTAQSAGARAHRRPGGRARRPEGLERYVKLVKESNFRRLGFESLAEVRFAKLGAPFDDVFIPLDRLRAYTAGSDVKAPVPEGRARGVPGGGERGRATRPSPSPARPTAGLEGGGLRSAQLIRSSPGPARAAASSDLPLGRYFIVRVPALSVQVLGLADPSDADGLSFVLVLPYPRARTCRSDSPCRPCVVEPSSCHIAQALRATPQVSSMGLRPPFRAPCRVGVGTLQHPLERSCDERRHSTRLLSIACVDAPR